MVGKHAHTHTHTADPTLIEKLIREQGSANLHAYANYLKTTNLNRDIRPYGLAGYVCE